MNGSRLGTPLVVVVAVAALASMGCGSSSSSGGSCQPPNLDGSVFGGKGTATLTGAGTLPDGIPDGLELEVLVKSGISSFGVLPDNLFAPPNDRICGKSFHYAVHKLDPGTYTLTFEVFDTNSNSHTPVFQGTAPSDFTIADGQMLMLDTTFQLSAM
jgi:hypothetical protein